MHRGAILAAGPIPKSSTLATNVHLPFICKLHWALGVTVNWPGSGLSHISDLKSGTIMKPSPLSYQLQPTTSVYGFCNCSNLDGLTLYPISSPSVSNADAMQDPSMGELGQGVWDWESQLGKVDRAWKRVVLAMEGKWDWQEEPWNYLRK